MNAWGIFWMVALSVAVVTACVAVGWWLQFVMVKAFLRHLDAHEQRCASENREQQRLNADERREHQKTSHEFHLMLNENTREAFKEVVRVIGEARDVMGTSSVAATGVLKYLALKGFLDVPEVPADEGAKGPEQP